jgi:hypothetical protein
MARPAHPTWFYHPNYIWWSVHVMNPPAMHFSSLPPLPPSWVKVTLPLCLIKYHAMKAYWGSGGIAPRILWPRH